MVHTFERVLKIDKYAGQFQFRSAYSQTDLKRKNETVMNIFQRILYYDFGPNANVKLHESGLITKTAKK